MACDHYHRRPEDVAPMSGLGTACSDPVTADGRVSDPDRIDLLHRHPRAPWAATDAGVGGRGWAEGCANRFGLVYLDDPTDRRVPKASHDWNPGVVAGDPGRRAGVARDGASRDGA